jgi:hypothetical protein
MYSGRLSSITITEEDAFVVFEYIKTHSRILFVLFTNLCVYMEEKVWLLVKKADRKSKTSP